MTTTPNKFHWLFGPASGHARGPLDVVVRETAHFAVLPSVGSIVPGWLLIVPKFPVARISEVNRPLLKELAMLVNELTAELQTLYGPVFSFEHGGTSGSLVSCGVDQAHLHLVPLPFDLVARSRSEPDFNWTATTNSMVPLDVAISSEYLFVSSQDEAYYTSVAAPVSQWFRKLIAREMGCGNMWDYKQHEFAGNLIDTVKRIGAHG